MKVFTREVGIDLRRQLSEGGGSEVIRYSSHDGGNSVQSGMGQDEELGTLSV